MITHDIHNVQFTRANPELREEGLLGFVKFDCGPFRFDGVQVRRSRASKLRIAFPEKLTSNGVAIPYVRPLTSACRNEVESRLFRELWTQGVI